MGDDGLSTIRFTSTDDEHRLYSATLTRPPNQSSRRKTALPVNAPVEWKHTARSRNQSLSGCDDVQIVQCLSKPNHAGCKNKHQGFLTRDISSHERMRVLSFAHTLTVKALATLLVCDLLLPHRQRFGDGHVLHLLVVPAM